MFRVFVFQLKNQRRIIFEKIKEDKFCKKKREEKEEEKEGEKEEERKCVTLGIVCDFKEQRKKDGTTDKLKIKNSIQKCTGVYLRKRNK